MKDYITNPEDWRVKALIAYINERQDDSPLSPTCVMAAINREVDEGVTATAGFAELMELATQGVMLDYFSCEGCEDEDDVPPLSPLNTATRIMAYVIEGGVKQGAGGDEVVWDAVKLAQSVTGLDLDTLEDLAAAYSRAFHSTHNLTN